MGGGFLFRRIPTLSGRPPLFETVQKVLLCHPELVSGSENQRNKMLKQEALNYAKWECAMAPFALIQHDKFSSF